MTLRDFAELDRKRENLNVSVVALCSKAGVSERTYRRMRKGLTRGYGATLARLQAALGRFKMAFAGDGGPIATHAAYKAAMVIACAELKTDPKAALFSDPARKATANEAWMEAARIRQLAMWIANGQLGLRVSEVARAAGVSKQAVSKATREVEDDPDPEIRRACDRLEKIFSW